MNPRASISPCKNGRLSRTQGHTAANPIKAAAAPRVMGMDIIPGARVIKAGAVSLINMIAGTAAIATSQWTIARKARNATKLTQKTGRRGKGGLGGGVFQLVLWGRFEGVDRHS